MFTGIVEIIGSKQGCIFFLRGSADDS